MQDTNADRELAGRALRGDEAAWRQIYEATCDRLFSFLCYQARDRDEALDLLQETYLQAYRRLSDYRGDGGLEAWLRMIALRKVLDWRRAIRRRRERREAIPEDAVAVEPDLSSVRFDSERSRFRRALQTLAPKQRAALLLREWEEWSFREISAALRCKESTARVHHTRALEKMRRALSRGPTCVAAEGLEGQEI